MTLIKICQAYTYVLLPSLSYEVNIWATIHFYLLSIRLRRTNFRIFKLKCEKWPGKEGIYIVESYPWAFFTASRNIAFVISRLSHCSVLECLSRSPTLNSTTSRLCFLNTYKVRWFTYYYEVRYYFVVFGYRRRLQGYWYAFYLKISLLSQRQF